MTRIGVVGVKDGWSSEQLLRAFRERHCEAEQIDMACVRMDLALGRAWHHDLEISALDAIVVKKIGAPYGPGLRSRLEILRHLAGSGVPVFSNPQRIEEVIDRLSGTVTLRLHNIPMPPTLITEQLDDAIAAVREFGTAVLKPLYSTKAEGMMLVTAGDREVDRVHDFRAAGNRVLYVQKLVPLPGRDLGLVFLGGEYIGCYARVKNGKAWNTTIRAGGRYEQHDPSEEIIALARRAQAPFGLDFTCVDVVETDDGPLVFEVSAFGGFRGLWAASGVDAAQQYADFVLKRIQHAVPAGMHN